MSREPLYRRGQVVTVYHQKPGRSGSPIQMRGTVLSFDGDRLVLHRSFKGAGRPYDGLGGVLSERGDHGAIECVKRSWIVRRRYRRADGTSMGELFNVNTPTRFLRRGVEYLDLEIDVAYRPHADERVVIVDRPELAEAIAAGHVPQDVGVVATAIAEELAKRLRAWDGEGPLEWDVRPTWLETIPGGLEGVAE